MKAEITIKFPRLKKEKYTKDIKDKLDILNRKAARAWLREVITHVPSYTGSARATLIPLGQFLRIAIPITKNPSAKKHGHHFVNMPGHFKFLRDNRRIEFRFSNDLFYYILNDLFNMNPPIHLIHPSPWHSFKSGKQAYQDYIRDNIRKFLPNWKDYLE